MPRGDKSAYTDKQKRMAEHIEEGYEARGVPEDEAERRAWATVNKETGGGNLSGSGRGVPDTAKSARKGGRIGGKRSHSGSRTRKTRARSTVPLKRGRSQAKKKRATATGRARQGKRRKA
jgi:hypothetical protein